MRGVMFREGEAWRPERDYSLMEGGRVGLMCSLLLWGLLEE